MAIRKLPVSGQETTGFGAGNCLFRALNNLHSGQEPTCLWATVPCVGCAGTVCAGGGEESGAVDCCGEGAAGGVVGAAGGAGLAGSSAGKSSVKDISGCCLSGGGPSEEGGWGVGGSWRRPTKTPSHIVCAALQEEGARSKTGRGRSVSRA